MHVGICWSRKHIGSKCQKCKCTLWEFQYIPGYPMTLFHFLHPLAPLAFESILNCFPKTAQTRPPRIQKSFQTAKNANVHFGLTHVPRSFCRQRNVSPGLPTLYDRAPCDQMYTHGVQVTDVPSSDGSRSDRAYRPIVVCAGRRGIASEVLLKERK